MDPVTLIVTALAAGAASALHDGVSAAVKDAYARLKVLAKRRFADHPKGELVLAEHDAAPRTWGAPLAAELSAAGAAGDADLVAAAQALMSLVDEAGSRAGKYLVSVHDGQGVQVGDHGTQHNQYIHTYIATQVIQASTASVAGRVEGPRLPGGVPRVWNIPASNPGFTGRDDLLEAVRKRLLAGDKAVVQALHGMGGVGKTQLAAEYAHRFAAAYDLAWWVDSEQGGLIGDQFAALGLALGCIQAGTGIDVVRPVVLGALRERGDGCLLVFDNAASPADVMPWLPGGGHVLITSRERGWADVAAAVEVDVLARHESTAILRDRVAGLAEADADRLAGELGDLPLAVAQAAGFMAETAMAAAEYLDLLRNRAAQLLDYGSRGLIRGRWQLLGS
jgi:hypothetical protein